jgi:hypothetical protein
MVYAFECEPCQVRVYSATATRARGCPLCGETMTRAPLEGPRSTAAVADPRPLDAASAGSTPPPPD